MGSSSSKGKNRIKNEISDGRGVVDDEIMLDLIEKARNATCKIDINEEVYGSGFFCKIPYTSNENNLLNVLLTCEHVLNKELVFSDKDININVNGEEKIIDLKTKRKKWSNKILDYSCIEILEDDNIDSFYQIDDIIFEKNYSKDVYLKKNKNNIIIFAIMNNKKRGHSDGVIKKIDDYDEHYFIHNCNTYPGCTGGVIVNKIKNVVGMHKGEFTGENGNIINNIGIFIKDIIEDIKQNEYNNDDDIISVKKIEEEDKITNEERMLFEDKYEKEEDLNYDENLTRIYEKKDNKIFEDEENISKSHSDNKILKKNEIEMKIKIETDYLENKRFYFLYNTEKEKFINKLNESNVELFINEKKCLYKNYFYQKKRNLLNKIKTSK